MKNALNLIGWLGTGLVVAAVGIRLLRPELDQYAVYGAWAGLACVVLYTLGQYREILDYFKQRNARYGAVASLSVVLFLGVMVAVNYLSTRQNKRWDLTKNQAFTLSDQTVKLLSSLDAPVSIKVFDKEDNFATFRASLEEYRYHNPSKVSVQYLDADKRPVEAKQYQVQNYGTVVLEYKGRVERVLSAEEAELTNGLVKVMTGEKKKVY